MNEPLEKFLQVVENPYEYVREWKEKSKKKVIACYPMHIPEEIIHAAGMLPVVIWRGNEPINLGLPFAPTYHCGFVRSFIDDVVRDAVGFLDGMVFYDTCLVARGAEWAATRHNPPPYVKYIHLPLATSSAGKEFGLGILKDFCTSLEETSGNEVSQKSLEESIKIYNENRSLLRKLYELRRKNPGILKAKEVVAIVKSSALMPKEEHNKLLRKLLDDLGKKEAGAKTGVKLVLSGHFCHSPRFDLLDIIEDLGGIVVDDDLYTGSRYFANDVEEGMEPLTALLARYMKDFPPDPTKVNTKGKWTDWGDFIVEVVKRSSAEGVISLMVKFCPPHQEWHPCIKRVLDREGIRELLLQTEHEAVSLAPIKTRIEAFIESIESGRR